MQEWLPTGPCAFRKQWGCKNDIATKVRTRKQKPLLVPYVCLDVEVAARAGRGFQPRRAARRRAARRAAWVWPRWRWRPRWWPLGLDEHLWRWQQWNSGRWLKRIECDAWIFAAPSTRPQCFLDESPHRLSRSGRSEDNFARKQPSQYEDILRR